MMAKYAGRCPVCIEFADQMLLRLIIDIATLSRQAISGVRFHYFALRFGFRLVSVFSSQRQRLSVQ